MTKTNSDNQTANTARLKWNPKGQPVSPQFDDVYFSTESGYEESRYTFLEANNLPQRWQTIANSSFAIGETGFGTGLNFLVAWQAWRECKKKHTQQLHFISVEKYPLSRQDLVRALDLWPNLRELSDQLLRSYPPQPSTGLHRLAFDNNSVMLSIYFGEASSGFAQIAPVNQSEHDATTQGMSFGTGQPKIDAWFLDGFAPAKNPEMWSTDLFQAITAVSAPGTTFSTFTAATAVNKGLTSAGFSCVKRKGFGRKREMLCGTMEITPNRHDETPPPFDSLAEPHKQATKETNKAKRENTWHLTDNSQHLPHAPHTPIKHCIVIGAGLAGCHTAFALAQRNIDVTVLERNSHAAQGASGNRQAILYAKLSPSQDPLSTFNLAALLYAHNFYRDNKHYQNCGKQCGVLHTSHNLSRIAQYRELSHIFQHEPQFMQWLDAHSASAVSGVDTAQGGLYLPESGWISPRHLCRQLLDHPKITLRTDIDVTSLSRENQRWHVYQEQNLVAQADGVVVANAHLATKFQQSAHFPVKHIRGQVSHAQPSTTSEKLACVICGDGYIAPTVDGLHTLGATFTLNNADPTLAASDHIHNLDKAKRLSKDLQNLSVEHTSDGRVGFRCTTPDYLPIVGPIPDFERMIERFRPLSRNANTAIGHPGAYHPNLYCSVGYGSRGLCYTPLSADLLASMITGQFLPIERNLYRHLSPARFIIRDLIRNKI